MKYIKVVGPMNGKFTIPKCPIGTIDKGRMICLCKKEFAYHQSSSSLADHIKAKHPVSSAATANVSCNTEWSLTVGHASGARCKNPIHFFIHFSFFSIQNTAKCCYNFEKSVDKIKGIFTFSNLAKSGTV